MVTQGFRSACVAQPRSSYEILNTKCGILKVLDFQLAQSAEISASTTDYSGANNLAETKVLLKIGQLVARKVYKQWESLLVSVCFLSVFDECFLSVRILF